VRLPSLRRTALVGPVGRHRDRRLAAARRADPVERQRLAPQELVDLGREQPPRAGRRTAGGRALAEALGEQHEPAGLADRQRFEQDGVEEREDGSVGADAERQRQHSDDRESRLANQRPQRETRVQKHWQLSSAISCQLSAGYQLSAECNEIV
jgi:hypothetical protein